MSEDEKHEARALACKPCGGTGLKPCHHIGTGRDADGWCLGCDAPTDQAGSTTCDCQEAA